MMEKLSRPPQCTLTPRPPSSCIFPPSYFESTFSYHTSSIPSGNLKRSSSRSGQTLLELANTSTAATDSQAQRKKNKTKSPEDATEQARRPEESEKMIEPADGDAEDFEDDPSAWK